MAGGRGKRLGQLTEKLPKPLLPIDNIPTISRVMRCCERAGIKHTVITTGYLGEKIKERYKGIFRSIHLDYSHEESPLGTAGGVKAAAKIGESGDILVLSGDAVYEGDITRLISLHYKKSADVTIGAKAVEDVTGYGVIVGKNSKIEGFVEKPKREESPSNIVNTGMYVISEKVLSEIPDGEYDFGHQLFPVLLEKGFSLCYAPLDGYWCDIGSVEAYYNCNMRYSGGKNVIGNNCRIGKGAEISRSVLLDGVSVGERAVIKDSVVCTGAVIPKGARIQRALVGEGQVSAQFTEHNALSLWNSV